MLHTLSDRDPIVVAPAPVPARAPALGSTFAPVTRVAPPPAEDALLERLQALADAPALLDAVPLMRQRVAAGASLLHEGAPARQVAVVLAGTFKTVKTGDDGYEHVLGFAMRGDLLGFDGLANGRHASAAVALEDSVVFVLPLAQFDRLRHDDARFDQALQAALSRQLNRAIELAELMSAVAADARLARFLLHLSERLAAQGMSPRRLRLRMNRREIASHLGVAHETVSRSFGVLADRGWLRVDNREIEIVDRDGLRVHAHCTRGPVEEPMRPSVRPSLRSPARPMPRLPVAAAA